MIEHGGSGMIRYTTTKSVSWEGRSIVAFLKAMGFILALPLLLGAVVLMAWNESRTVTTERSLEEGQAVIVEVAASPVDPARDGRLIHVTGDATAPGDVTDLAFGVSVNGALVLQRDVEMYQWKETERTRRRSISGTTVRRTEYSYDTEWSGTPIDSSRFHRTEGHENPLMPFEGRTMLARNARLGGFSLPGWILSLVPRTEPIPPQRLSLPADLQPRMRPNGEWLMSGDGASPSVGDLRVRFLVAPGQTLSVVAQQSGDTLERYQTRAGERIGLVEPGAHPAHAMFETELENEAVKTWSLRASSLVAMLIGFLLLLGPLRALAMAIPFLGNLVRGASFVVALALTAVLGFLVIGIFWISVRPLVGLPMLAMAALALVLLWWYGRRRTRTAVPAAAGGPPPPPPPPA